MDGFCLLRVIFQNIVCASAGKTLEFGPTTSQDGATPTKDKIETRMEELIPIHLNT